MAELSAKPHTELMEIPAVRRIVSLQPSVTVILRELGRLDLLAACTKYCAVVCPEVTERGITIVADSWTAQAEQIRQAKPDFVMASVPYQEKSLAELLKAGVPVLALSPKKIADIYSDISIISRLVDAQEAGESVIGRMQQEIEKVRNSVAGLGRPRVFCEEWGKPLIASQAWVAELVEAAGGEFIGTPGAQVDAAEIREIDPEVLIAAWCGAGDRVPLTKIVDARGWQEMAAVKARRVYCIADEYLNTPAPTLMHGLMALAWAIHQERFAQPEGVRCIGNP
jgi:iron complex transport system substrate-binding protein